MESIFAVKHTLAWFQYSIFTTAIAIEYGAVSSFDGGLIAL
jgi:hypothetical protein